MGRAPGSPNTPRSDNSRGALRSISALPSLRELAIDGVSCEINQTAQEMEVVLSKTDWKAPATAAIPLRYLRAGDFRCEVVWHW